ncbi:hypothetical protein AWB80_07530 [Caballeronia pedi]|uniref:Uncharacterized protein n=1 Tax=Caballeronia pedi TaxID=1777141 RepID=A0A158DV52_9BURK|nr:hypothetical protein [Caballeronia pedi]SAK98475.1 hypothetical protein AWB80_07530 [Caballeronia pedi]
MTTTVSKLPPMETYYVSGPDCAWATIAIRGWSDTAEDERVLHRGEILINSDFGNFAHRWNHMGMPIKDFLVKIGRNYLLDKLAPGDVVEFDFDASLDSVRRHIIKQRRAGVLDHDDARSAWNDVPTNHSSKEIFTYLLTEGEYFRCIDFDTIEGMLVERENVQLVGFYDAIWIHFVEQLRTEIRYG